MRKFGVIGSGNRASIIDAVKEFPDWQLGMFADTDPARADKFKEMYPEAKFTTDYRDVLADPEMTLAALNKKTTKEVNTKADGLKIKGSTKVGEAEKLFDQNFGVTVQIKDKAGKVCVPNGITIGQAARGEYK